MDHPNRTIICTITFTFNREEHQLPLPFSSVFVWLSLFLSRFAEVAAPFPLFFASAWRLDRFQVSNLSSCCPESSALPRLLGLGLPALGVGEVVKLLVLVAAVSHRHQQPNLPLFLLLSVLLIEGRGCPLLSSFGNLFKVRILALSFWVSFKRVRLLDSSVWSFRWMFP